jgi:hypothetical protein
LQAIGCVAIGYSFLCAFLLADGSDDDDDDDDDDETWEWQGDVNTVGADAPIGSASGGHLSNVDDAGMCNVGM